MPDQTCGRTIPHPAHLFLHHRQALPCAGLPAQRKDQRRLAAVACRTLSGEPDGIHLSVLEWLPGCDAWATGPALCGRSAEQGALPEDTVVTCEDCEGYRESYERALSRRPSAEQEQIARLTAERDELLAELDGRGKKAAKKWVKRQVEQLNLRYADFRAGRWEMDLSMAREMGAAFTAMAKALLGDAPNYTETKLYFDVKIAESPEMYTLVVQRHAPGVLTPHEARLKAEAERDAARAEAEELREQVASLWPCTCGHQLGQHEYDSVLGRSFCGACPGDADVHPYEAKETPQ